MPIRDVAAVSRFELAWNHVGAVVASVPPVPERAVVRFAVGRAAAALLAATDPTTVVPRRLATMMSVGDVSLLTTLDDRLVVTETSDRVMAFPELPVPVYTLLARYDRDRFLPGVELIPPNAITLLETNPRFIEAFMIGMNHEMNRELLWREYPTDRRGSPLRHFWDWFDDLPDIEPLHTWPTANALGHNTRGGEGGQIVLLVRGDLLRRYPNAVVLAGVPPAAISKIRPLRTTSSDRYSAAGSIRT